eukprot:scaffold99091_cov88-Phaeocystis_antarctica.AAC.4
MQQTDRDTERETRSLDLLDDRRPAGPMGALVRPSGTASFTHQPSRTAVARKSLVHPLPGGPGPTECGVVSKPRHESDELT